MKTKPKPTAAECRAIMLDAKALLLTPYPRFHMGNLYKPVKSSNLRAVRLVEDSLEVVFHSGQRWSYSPVDADLFKELVEAESIGKAFHSLVKSRAGEGGEIVAVPMQFLTEEELIPLLEAAQEA